MRCPEVRGRRGPEAGVTCAPCSENLARGSLHERRRAHGGRRIRVAREAQRTDVAPHLVARRRARRTCTSARAIAPICSISSRRCPKARRCSGWASAATCWCGTAASAAWSSTRRAASRASNASTTPPSPAKPACRARASRVSASSGVWARPNSWPEFPERSAARSR